MAAAQHDHLRRELRQRYPSSAARNHAICRSPYVVTCDIVSFLLSPPFSGELENLVQPTCPSQGARITRLLLQRVFVAVPMPNWGELRLEAHRTLDGRR